MKLKHLIGFQIVDINDYEMTVTKDSSTFTIRFDTDHGDCCGYADITSRLLVDLNNKKVNPIITNIEYCEDEDDGEENVRITFFGECKPIAEIDARAGSGSGWGYGATATATCQLLDMDETIASW